MTCNPTHPRSYIAAQPAHTPAKRAIAEAGPEDVTFRPIGPATSELYFGTTKLGYIEQIAVAPATPIVHCYLITFTDDVANPQTLHTLEDPADVLRDILRHGLHKPALALPTAE